MSTPTESLDEAWIRLLDGANQRGDAYHQALNKVRLLVADRRLSRADLIKKVDEIADRAFEEAWAKANEARKTELRGGVSR